MDAIFFGALAADAYCGCLESLGQCCGAHDFFAFFCNSFNQGTPKLIPISNLRFLRYLFSILGLGLKKHLSANPSKKAKNVSSAPATN